MQTQGGPDRERVQELAVELFDLGLNCAEASLTALGCAPGWALPGGASAALGFGAGLARAGLTCGCLTGSSMALGLLAGRRDPGQAEVKDAVYAAVTELLERFQARFGASDCRTLTGLDFRDPAEQARFRQEIQSRCREYLREAIGLALARHDQVVAAAPVLPAEPGFRLAQGAVDDAIGRFLLREYAASLDFSLDFQDFTGELADLPRRYHAPEGALILAEVGGSLAGCVALRSLEPGMAEMKRLYVRPRVRGAGLGRALIEQALARAAVLGFRAVRLDTVPSMQAAQALYRSLGFQAIAPYRENPVVGARYFERRL